MMKKRNVVVHQKQTVYDDFFKVEEAFLQFERFDGRMSEKIRRLNFDRGDAVAVLIFNRDRRSVILVNQFRYPTYETGGGWVTEVVAGILEKGEKPEDTARREVIEEIGYQVSQLESIGTFYTSPGGSSERIFLYFALVNDSDRVSGGGGLDSEQEDIQRVEITMPDLWPAIEAGEFSDAKTIIALMWLKNQIQEGKIQ